MLAWRRRAAFTFRTLHEEEAAQSAAGFRMKGGIAGAAKQRSNSG